MCLTCGCGMPYDNMGDAKNLTVKDLKESVETADGKGLSEQQAVDNLVETWKKVKSDDKNYKAS